MGLYAYISYNMVYNGVYIYTHIRILNYMYIYIVYHIIYNMYLYIYVCRGKNFGELPILGDGKVIRK